MIARGAHARREKRGRPVAVLQDLQGPKIRVGRFADGHDRARAGRRLHAHHARRAGRRRDRVDDLRRACRGDVKPGDMLLLDDGLLSLEVDRVERHRRHDARARRRHAQEQQGHQPARREGVGARADREGPARPRVRAAARRRLRRAVVRALARRRRRGGARWPRADGRRMPIIAKIEKPEAVERLERDHRRRRRHHGRARRSRRRDGRRRRCR